VRKTWDERLIESGQIREDKGCYCGPKETNDACRCALSANHVPVKIQAEKLVGRENLPPVSILTLGFRLHSETVAVVTISACRLDHNPPQFLEVTVRLLYVRTLESIG